MYELVWTAGFTRAAKKFVDQHRELRTKLAATLRDLENDPFQPAVVSVTRIHGGTTFNVIPESVELEGTVRTMDAALRARVPELMRRVLDGVTRAHGASFTLAYVEGYRPVVNDAKASALLRRAVVRALGKPPLETWLAPRLGAFPAAAVAYVREHNLPGRPDDTGCYS